MKKKSDSKFGGKKCVTFSVCDGTQDATSISTMFIWSNYRCINYLIFVDHKLNNIWLKLKYCKQHNHNLVYYRLVDDSSATERQVQTNYYALRYDGQMRVSRFCVSTSLLLLCIDGDWSSQVERQWIFIFFSCFSNVLLLVFYSNAQFWIVENIKYSYLLHTWPLVIILWVSSKYSLTRLGRRFVYVYVHVYRQSYRLTRHLA